jgi:hypothetical protein
MVSIYNFVNSIPRSNPEKPARSAHPATPRPIVLLTVLGLLLCARAVWAAPATAEQARQVAQAWLSIQPRPLDAPLGDKIARVETFADALGQPVYYIAYLDPKGFLIVSADDLIEPVVGFLPDGQYDPSPSNPLGTLVSQDLKSRLANVRSLQASKSAMPQALATAQSKWKSLANAAGTQPSPLTMLNSVSDIRVSPLIQSKWDQATAYPGGPNCYNFYTPNNSVCGCVATAMSQLMRYWHYPVMGIGVHSMAITVDGSSQVASTRGGDGAGGPYNWSQMVLVPDPSITNSQCQAIGSLCYDAGVSVGMMYTLQLSGAYMQDSRRAMVATFQYGNAILGGNEMDNIGAPLSTMINPNLDGGCPCLLGISGSAGGHAIVVDGYGYSLNSLYHHLNMGWSGQDDAWYNLPTIDTSWVTFPSVDSCIYNIFTSDKGEILSGRVTDRTGKPIKGATVLAQQAGGTNFTATTNANGIYAFMHVPSASTFNVCVIGAYSSARKDVSTGTSSNQGPVGNVWGIDFTAAPAGPPVAQFSKAAYSVCRDDGTATITVTLDGSNTGGLSLECSTIDGSALAGTDYTATNMVLTFQPYAVEATFSVKLGSDLYDPDSKTLSLVLSNPAGGLSLGTPNTATLTLAGSQTLPILSVAGARQKEGNSGTAPFTFDASLSRRSILPVTVAYQTSNGTTAAGEGYVATSGTLTILPGQTSGSIEVPVFGDTIYEPTKTFLLSLRNVTGAILATSRVQGTIENDDPPPTISIDDATGCAPSMSFKVNLSSASALPVTVSFRTNDGTAVAGTHYSRVNGTLAIPAGQTSAAITVQLRTVSLHEADKTFNIALSNPSGSSIGRDQAIGTVLCSVPAPVVQIEDGTDMGPFLSFGVHLSAGSDSPVTICYCTADGTAVADQDYTPVNGTLLIPAGQRFSTIIVPIVNHPSQAKTLLLKTSDLVNASTSTPQATGIIQPAAPTPDTGTTTPSSPANQCGVGASGAALFCCLGLAVLKLSGSSTVTRRRR